VAEQKESRRGFAAMTTEQRHAIASRGGKAAHARGAAHTFTPEAGAAAGRKGGRAAHAQGVAHEFTPAEARAAGRKGGKVPKGRARARAARVAEAAARLVETSPRGAGDCPRLPLPDGRRWPGCGPRG
jgi:hypothetical protein